MTLAYMSKETKKTIGDKKQPIRKEVSYPAQKLASEVSLTDVVQRLIDPAAIPNWFSISQEGMNELASRANRPEFAPESPISGASRGGHVFLTDILRDGSSPCYLLDMSDWMNYLTQDERSVNLLEDPNRLGNTLTRMHVINGRFFGPSASYNMVLGTQEDNARHLNSAERYIYRFFGEFYQNVAGVKEGDRPLGVLYEVLPTNFHVPRYITQIFPDIRRIDFIDFRNWIADACPQNLHCMAQFYIVDKNGRFWYSPEQYESVPIN